VGHLLDFPVANYIAGGDGLDVRSDLGSLHLSDVPTVMVELGNMRNAAEARVMTSPKGRTRYASGLVAASAASCADRPMVGWLVHTNFRIWGPPCR